MITRFLLACGLTLAALTAGTGTASASPQSAACAAADVAWFNIATATTARDRAFWTGQYRSALRICNTGAD